MTVKTYINRRGEIFGEISGGARRNYVRDALGSVVAETDSANAKLYSARYKPNGSTLTSTGTAPSFTWVGTLGYLKSAGVSYTEFSVRARFYSTRTARWSRVDPLWLEEQPYTYADSNPITWMDPTGLDSAKCIVEPCPSPIPNCPLGIIKAGPFAGKEKDAETKCDFDTGLTYAYSCYKGTNSECIYAHELGHAQDLSACCFAAYLCSNYLPYPICQDIYSDWRAKNYYQLECRGFNKQLKCLKDIRDKCLKDRRRRNDPECIDVGSQIKSYSNLASLVCIAGTDLTPCPVPIGTSSSNFS